MGELYKELSRFLFILLILKIVLILLHRSVQFFAIWSLYVEGLVPYYDTGGSNMTEENYIYRTGGTFA